MDDRYWIRLLPWRQKNKAESKSAQIKFAPKLSVTRDHGWRTLQLLLVNRSSWTVWVEEATVALTDLDANSQTVIASWQARQQILQNVSSYDSLSVSLARAIYDAAGRPQGPYSCLVITNVRYRVFDEWCDAKLETCRVVMAAITVVGLRSAKWYDKKVKQINDLFDQTTRRRKG
jgi:hypothetical protein